jgi:transcription elongation factor Elf1
MQIAVLDTDGYAICPDCGTLLIVSSNLRSAGNKATKMALCGVRDLWANFEREAGSARVDDVIFPYIDMCLIT